jgi:hypothetical protein
MEGVFPIDEKQERVDAGDGEPGGGVRRERHVQRLLEHHRIQHARDRIDVDRVTVNQVETGGRIHPRVRRHHEDSRGGAGYSHHDAGQQVGPPGDPFPAVEVDAEEDRLGEEGESLEREGHPYHGAGELHEGGPEEAQLEREDGARDRAHREENGGALRPALGEIEVDGVARLLPASLGDDHQGRHADADDGEDDVES